MKSPLHNDSMRLARSMAARFTFVFLVCPAAATLASANDALTVDFAEPCGTLRPLHGLNTGPLPVNGQKGPDLTSRFKEAAIPNCRLHDVVWSGARVVDIPLVFPLQHLDPADPKNYLFARTDEYIQGIISAGAQVVYRLGTSVEHSEKNTMSTRRRISTAGPRSA